MKRMNSQQRDNLATVRASPLLSRLLFLLFDRPQLLPAIKDVVFSLLSAIIQPPCDPQSLLKLGQVSSEFCLEFQAVAATLPTTEEDAAAEESLPFHIAELQTVLLGKETNGGTGPSAVYLVYIRNRVLNMLANFLSHSSPSLNVQ